MALLCRFAAYCDLSRDFGSLGAVDRRGWIIASVGFLAGYWILMRFIPVPGFGIPTHDIPLLDPDRNLAAWLDRKLLMGHLYEGTRDPEGVLSTIPAIATTLLGVLTGEWLRSERGAPAKAASMAFMGVAALGLGEFLNNWFPINKKLGCGPALTSSSPLDSAGLFGDLPLDSRRQTLASLDPGVAGLWGESDCCILPCGNHCPLD